MESAYGTAYQKVYPVYSEMAAHDAEDRDRVPDREGREGEPVGSAGRRIDRGWPRCAVGRSQHIDADYEIPVGVEELRRTDKLRPPVLGIRVGSQGMTDPDDLFLP